MTERDSTSKFLDQLADFMWEDQAGETTEELSEQLRQDGFEPERLHSRVGHLIGRIGESRRLQWMEQADEERKRALGRLQQAKDLNKTRSQLLAGLRAHPQIAARNLDTRLEDMSDEQLAELDQEILWAQQLDEDEDI